MSKWIVNTERYLTETEQKNNAAIICSYFREKGWTFNAIAGMFGCMEGESRFNPQQWQSFQYGNLQTGYGLTQWTPASKYINWAGSDYETNHNKQLDRIQYEMTVAPSSTGQYFPTSSYPDTRTEFTVSTKSPAYLACAWAWNYERSNKVLNGSEAVKEALKQEIGEKADKWYSYIRSITLPEVPDTSKPTPPAELNLPLWILFKFRNRRF